MTVDLAPDPMNSVVRILLFVSALAPAALVAALAQARSIGTTRDVVSWIVASCLACLLPLLLVQLAARSAERLPFAAKKVESQDWLLVGVVVSYFLPLALKITDLWTFVPIVLLAAVLLATLDAIPCHPVLHVFRYRFYKVEGSNGIVYTMISRRPLLTASDIRVVKQLTPQLLLLAEDS